MFCIEPLTVTFSQGLHGIQCGCVGLFHPDEGFFFPPVRMKISCSLAWCVALNLTHRYNFIFLLDVVLLFFWLRVVQLNEEKVNARSNRSTHHGPCHRDPPPAAPSSAVKSTIHINCDDKAHTHARTPLHL